MNGRQSGRFFKILSSVDRFPSSSSRKSSAAAQGVLPPRHMRLVRLPARSHQNSQSSRRPIRRPRRCRRQRQWLLFLLGSPHFRSSSARPAFPRVDRGTAAASSPHILSRRKTARAIAASLSAVTRCVRNVCPQVVPLPISLARVALH